MIVSWNWLADYLDLKGITPDEVATRLMMAGLNHESTEPAGDDTAIDVEVTSNRPDCLGHIGVAREISVLFGRPLKLADPQPKAAGKQPVAELSSVTIENPQACSRYTARVIRGVKIGPSPAWLAKRLQTLGIAVINNVVDITNYVMMECGQPLHAFDLAKIGGKKIIVRQAKAGEQLEAIDHRTYALDPSMCAICDASKPVALAGVMGGASTEVSNATTDVLIESADFDPLTIRATARKLRLHSPSSYRFERSVDPAGIDWASRRCCELILQLAGGELAPGSLDVGTPVAARQPITLRLSQIPRILGIEIPTETTRKILRDLGLAEQSASKETITTSAPSWRRDLEREIDLIEEVARIHGYDKIPEDVAVPMTASHRTRKDRVLGKIRSALSGAAFNEALTVSLVPEEMSSAFSPWSAAPPLKTLMPMLRGADCLRRSLVPSLLASRRDNESLANDEIELFEVASIYLPQQGKAAEAGLPEEQVTIALTSGRDFSLVKGLIEGIVALLNISERITVEDCQLSLVEAGQGCRLKLGDKLLGYLGTVSAAGQKQLGLRGPTTIAELRLATLVDAAQLIPQQRALSNFPAIARDLNLVVDEVLRWSDLEATVRGAAEFLEELNYRETYRDAKKDGPGKKRLLFSFTLRSPDRTLTSDEADAIRQKIVGECGAKHGAVLLA